LRTEWLQGKHTVPVGELDRMSPEETIKAVWIFGSIFAVLGVMLSLHFFVGGRFEAKEKSQQHEEQ
jgi:hypothetical protein